MRRSALLFALIASPLALGGCAGDDAGSAPDIQDGLFGESVERVSVEVDYETTAAPYTSWRARSGSPWSLAKANVEALFAGAPGRAIEVPLSLDEMTDLGDLGRESWSGEAILELARERRSTEPVGPGARALYVVFLDGLFEDGGTARDDVLGVSLGATGVIAIFKPVVAASVASERYVEQTTVVHEIGHAVGLVANGIEPTSAHHDAENGAHCTNRDCVMFWQNEGPGGALEFARKVIATGDLTMFGRACVADAVAAAR